MHQIMHYRKTGKFVAIHILRKRVEFILLITKRNLQHTRSLHRQDLVSLISLQRPCPNTVLQHSNWSNSYISLLPSKANLIVTIYFKKQQIRQAPLPKAKKNIESVRQQLETDILDSTHIVLTTLGTSGCKALESAAKFEVVVVDEAAQSVEPATLVALQLGSSHAILVGDPQQLPATIFSVSGRNTKYDRSLFQRLEGAGHEIHLLDTQYRMHPEISEFPRKIFYGGYLKDGSNVSKESYGNPFKEVVRSKFPAFRVSFIRHLQ